jgi:SAM-dependent methyltransferase
MNRAPCPRALDIGIGLGAIANRLREHAEEFIGIDISGENLTRIRQQTQGESVDLLKMSSEHLGFSGSLFDIVLLIDVLEHVADDKRTLDEIFRVLRPGGFLIVTAPNKLFPIETHGCHIRGRQVDTRYFGVPFLPYLPESLRARYANVRIYTPWRLQQIITSAGFRIRDTEYIGPNFDRITARYPKSARVMKYFQTISQILDTLPLIRVFSTTIMVCAEKRTGQQAES